MAVHKQTQTAKPASKYYKRKHYNTHLKRKVIVAAAGQQQGTRIEQRTAVEQQLIALQVKPTNARYESEVATASQGAAVPAASARLPHSKDAKIAQQRWGGMGRLHAAAAAMSALTCSSTKTSCARPCLSRYGRSAASRVVRCGSRSR